MIERFKRRFKQEKGFTLVELLAVIAILGIVAAIAVPTVSNVIDSSKSDTHDANKELMENAARLANTNGVDPEEGEDYTLQNLVDKGYLQEIPTNPNTDSDYNGTVKRTEKTQGDGDDGDTVGYKFEYKVSD